MNINTLYEKKAEYLLEVLRITESIDFTDDIESNINNFNSLHEIRGTIFAKIYEIDDEINAMYYGQPIFDENIKDIAAKIIKADKVLDKHKDEFNLYLTDKIRGLKQGRKARDRFSPYSKSDVSTFESKA